MDRSQSRSQRMIDAANDSQEKFMREELKVKNPNIDYSEWTIWEMIQEMKRLADEIKTAYAPKEKFNSDISDCCGKPITFEKDSTPVCTKCDQDCGAVNPEPTPREG